MVSMAPGPERPDAGKGDQRSPGTMDLLIRYPRGPLSWWVDGRSDEAGTVATHQFRPDFLA